MQTKHNWIWALIFVSSKLKIRYWRGSPYLGCKLTFNKRQNTSIHIQLFSERWNNSVTTWAFTSFLINDLQYIKTQKLLWQASFIFLLKIQWWISCNHAYLNPSSMVIFLHYRSFVLKPSAYLFTIQIVLGFLGLCVENSNCIRSSNQFFLINSIAGFTEVKNFSLQEERNYINVQKWPN